jgi:MIP family channel proteins
MSDTTGRRAYIAELLGTFGMVLLGTGAATLDGLGYPHEYPLGAAGVGLVFGLAVMSMILIFGKASGAHINPAVSLAMVAAGKLPAKRLAGYLIAQCCGAIVASVVVSISFPEATSIGETLPGSPGLLGCLGLEVFLTMVLVGVILWIIEQPWARGPIPALVIGATVGVEAWLAGPLCGASMNPARSLGPAIVSGNLQTLWIYIVGPVAGACCALLLFRWLRPVGGARDHCG